MGKRHVSRRRFLETGLEAALAAVVTPVAASASSPAAAAPPRNVVSIAAVKNGRIDRAVEEAIDLLGGIGPVTNGRGRILLKPNLVADSRDCTTKPEVVEVLARLMKGAGKEVVIGEASAAAGGFNAKGAETYRTRSRDILDPMQQHVFDRLGYTELARSLHVPLVNLHSGKMAEVAVKGAHAFPTLTLHESVASADLVCSVPMMKTHVLATVSLSMKNLIGLFPGTVYGSVRACVHDRAAEKGSPGIAYEIVDMVRANRTGLAVIDATTAMQGDGPVLGTPVEMSLIVAGTDPLAADMVATALMGIDPDDVPTFTCAHRAGMRPQGLDEIEVRGLTLGQARRAFVQPHVVSWPTISSFWGAKEI